MRRAAGLLGVVVGVAWVVDAQRTIELEDAVDDAVMAVGSVKVLEFAVDRVLYVQVSAEDPASGSFAAE